MIQVNSFHTDVSKKSNCAYSVKTTSNVFGLNKSASSHQITQDRGLQSKGWPALGQRQGIQKSFSTNCVIETKRGFKPSDIRDPTKKQFLTDLTQRIWKFGPVSQNIFLAVNVKLHRNR